MLGRTAGGLLRFLSAWEFESRVFPEIPKFGGFASPARYFYFTLSDFSNMRLLFLITLIFLLCVQKSRTSVRDFCLHLFCQCKLKSAGDSDTNTHPCHIGGASFSVVWVKVTKGVQIVREGCASLQK